MVFQSGNTAVQQCMYEIIPIKCSLNVKVEVQYLLYCLLFLKKKQTWTWKQYQSDNRYQVNLNHFMKHLSLLLFSEIEMKFVIYCFFLHP